MIYRYSLRTLVLFVFFVWTEGILISKDFQSNLQEGKLEFNKLIGEWKFDRVITSDGNDAMWSYMKDDGSSKEIMEASKWKIEVNKVIETTKSEVISIECPIIQIDYNKTRLWKYVMYKFHGPFEDKLVFKPYTRIKVFEVHCDRDVEPKLYLNSFKFIYVEKYDVLFYENSIFFLTYSRIK